MAKIDWEKERNRLADMYAAMEDAELEKIGAEPDSLTDVARQTLGDEMSRRGMKLPETSSSKVETPNIVMVRRYRDLPEASLAKSILDSAGIESVFADDNLVRIDWFYSNLVGGIKILVREEDAETADKLLTQDVPEKFDVEGVGEYKQPVCPRCQSLDVSFDGLDKRLSYSKCHSCGHEWNEDGDTKPPVPPSQ